MAYNTECADAGIYCTRLQYWSNPNVLYGGIPMGVPIGTSTACIAGDLNHPTCDSNNRQTLNDTAWTVANFRGRPGAVGPLVEDGYLLDDDNSGNCSGNGDGIANCGETVEMYLDLLNQGADTATNVYNTLSTTDSYVTFPLFNSLSSYGNIAGGASVTNTDEIDPATPHGHVIEFTLDITAGNGGP